MKPIPYIVALVGLIVGAATLPVSADTVLASSPDHPKTWEAGAAKSYLALRWDSKKNMLVADVTYSTQVWADATHPPEEQDEIITFPSVRFDPGTKSFTAKGVTIARLHPMFLGNDIVLEKGMELSVHRKHGFIYGKIIVAENS
jgi:hypothetical protein